MLKGLSGQNARLNVTDLYGRTVLTHAVDPDTPAFLELKGWQPGWYMLTVDMASGLRLNSRLLVAP